MKIRITEHKGQHLAEIDADNVLVHDAQEALDLIANCGYLGSTRLILLSHNLTPDFFDLKSGIAGDILQKFSTYDAHLAIVGDHTHYTSKSLNDFIRESNQQGRINFVNSLDEAWEVLSR